MTTATGNDYDSSTAGPLRPCDVCAPGRGTQQHPQYTDDPAGRMAHARAFGHYPRTRTEGDPA